MVDVQVQYRRKLAGSPALGKWQVYSSAWFSTSSTTPPAAVLLGLQNLFLGQTYLGTGTTWTAASPFDLAAGAGLITVHSWSGTNKVKVADHVVTVPNYVVASPQVLPSQCAIAVGYRSSTGVNVRRGRSRFFLGPLVLNSGYLTLSTSGGTRLNSTLLTQIRTNAVSAVAGLTAAGWTLEVSSDRPARAFAAATELYIDDVLDVMRTRRTWQLAQVRNAL